MLCEYIHITKEKDYIPIGLCVVVTLIFAYICVSQSVCEGLFAEEGVQDSLISTNTINTPTMTSVNIVLDQNKFIDPVYFLNSIITFSIIGFSIFGGDTYILSKDVADCAHH